MSNGITGRIRDALTSWPARLKLIEQTAVQLLHIAGIRCEVRARRVLDAQDTLLLLELHGEALDWSQERIDAAAAYLLRGLNKAIEMRLEPSELLVCVTGPMSAMALPQPWVVERLRALSGQPDSADAKVKGRPSARQADAGGASGAEPPTPEPVRGLHELEDANSGMEVTEYPEEDWNSYGPTEPARLTPNSVPPRREAPGAKPR
jgi:hypothetical protein